jgi:hypothetical protein
MGRSRELTDKRKALKISVAKKGLKTKPLQSNDEHWIPLGLSRPQEKAKKVNVERFQKNTIDKASLHKGSTTKSPAPWWGQKPAW